MKKHFQQNLCHLNTQKVFEDFLHTLASQCSIIPCLAYLIPKPEKGEVRLSMPNPSTMSGLLTVLLPLNSQ